MKPIGWKIPVIDDDEDAFPAPPASDTARKGSCDTPGREEIPALMKEVDGIRLSPEKIEALVWNGIRNIERGGEPVCDMAPASEEIPDG